MNRADRANPAPRVNREILANSLLVGTMVDVVTSRTLRSEEVAAALGMSAASISRYARAGRIPFTQTPGGHRRFNIDEVHSALDATSRVNLTSMPVPTGRVNIAPDQSDTVRSTADEYRSAIRTVYTGQGEDNDSSTPPALTELFLHSRRVLVGATSH